ncbi:ABC transporter ATP-binding protein [Dechloromonas sp. XY25]|uniref:ABC transporter ATP-binding protein n=1 Tax=Dechloromonas hankyongensis TaxID=2908002 RepID=A0ABS9JZR9_9RHOO|nr:ABC transporter ATP-binding protein [Dechloromonas hankyongensis]MCG2576366.1 ABC transporter ATP-binding protein [Dechloromonas hankyongensis]
MTDKTILAVDNLALSYGSNPILKDVSMQLRRGEVVSLLGPSGSGKTTLLRAVAGLEQPHAGSVCIAGRAIYDAAASIDIPAEKRDLGLVFQSYALWPHKTVFDNVAYPLVLRKVAKNDIVQRVHAALKNLGLDHLAERYPHQLSGGQQQRVSIARALVYNPPVILLDEPLSNLDAKMREEARAWLRNLIVEMQLSALVVTHDQSEAMAMSDRILLLNGGVIEQQGTPTEMYGQPQTYFVADFMGSNNIMTGRIGDIRGGEARIDLDNGISVWGLRRTNAAIGHEAKAVIRVEQVHLADAAGDNRAEVELATSMFLGDRFEYVFHAGSDLLRAWGKRHEDAGKRWLEFPRDSVWIF